MTDQRFVGGISWTDETWNPIRGCSRVSLGCGGPHGKGGCYAERLAIRFSGPGQPYEGLVRSTPNGPRWTGEVRLVMDAVDLPLHWRKPRRIFVNSMSDLFHERVPDEWIAAIFGAMAACPDHTFQVLTKRQKRMRKWFDWIIDMPEGPTGRCGLELNHKIGIVGMGHRWQAIENATWPLANVWLGVSVEDQPTADTRIPLLLQTPAAVRFVSYEPALGSVDFEPWLVGHYEDTLLLDQRRGPKRDRLLAVTSCSTPPVNWLIVGGESGPHARPFDLAWARSAAPQCRSAGVPFFFKQAGARPVDHGVKLHLRDRKGGTLDELPADLRIREFPQC